MILRRLSSNPPKNFIFLSNYLLHFDSGDGFVTCCKALLYMSEKCLFAINQNVIVLDSNI